MTLLARLVVKNLACERGGRTIFSNLNFELSAGQALELRGPNGAGKSTLLRLLAGLNMPLSGEVSLEGGALEKSLSEQAHYIGHQDALKLNLTVAQNLSFWAQFFGTAHHALPLSAFHLTSLADDPVQLLSSGQRRRLALSRLLTANRKLWLLDEPSVGLDHKSLVCLQAVVAQHIDEGGMVIAATHVDLGLAKVNTLQLGASA